MNNILHSILLNGFYLLKNSFISIIIAISLLGCGKDALSPLNKASDLKHSLSQIKGTFNWREDINQYEYSDKDNIEKILASQNQYEALLILVNCLDDLTVSLSAIDENKVPVGIVCYEALTQLVYFEPNSSDGDIATYWPGYITPRASPEEMRTAKEAWIKVIETNTYIFQ